MSPSRRVCGAEVTTLSAGVVGKRSHNHIVAFRDKAFTTGVWTLYREFQDTELGSVPVHSGCNLVSTLECFNGKQVEFVAVGQAPLASHTGKDTVASLLVVKFHGELYSHPLCDKAESLYVSYSDSGRTGTKSSVDDDVLAAYLRDISAAGVKTRFKKLKKRETPLDEPLPPKPPKRRLVQSAGEDALKLHLASCPLPQLPPCPTTAPSTRLPLPLPLALPPSAPAPPESGSEFEPDEDKPPCTRVMRQDAEHIQELDDCATSRLELLDVHIQELKQMEASYDRLMLAEKAIHDRMMHAVEERLKALTSFTSDLDRSVCAYVQPCPPLPCFTQDSLEFHPCLASCSVHEFNQYCRGVRDRQKWVLRGCDTGSGGCSEG